MKLYELKRGDKFFIAGNERAQVPVASFPIEANSLLTFHNVDGMYSFCTDEYGTIVHPAAWTEVEVYAAE